MSKVDFQDFPFHVGCVAGFLSAIKNREEYDRYLYARGFGDYEREALRRALESLIRVFYKDKPDEDSPTT